MANPVFLSGDFCSGSTLLFTLFRETGEYSCLYEPLHQNLREYLIWPLRVYEHHYFVKDYFNEYKGFSRIQELFNPAWANRKLHFTEETRAEDLYEYLSYLIEAASRSGRKVLLKFNRMSFRLAWLRAKFPGAAIVHIHRDPESQWKSIVARGQEHAGREDIGQGRVDFEGFNIGSWCEDLKSTFPELASDRSASGFERFSKLHARSLAAHREHAHVSVEFRALCKNFETECARIFDAVDCHADPARLKPLVILPENQRRRGVQSRTFSAKAANLIDRLGREYAKLRVQAYDRRRGDT